MALPTEAERYLAQLRMALSPLGEAEREEIVAEVRSHLLDRVASGKGALLDGFDAPETYAAEFLAERSLRGALAQGTSWALGRALLIGARDSLLALFVLLPLVVMQLAGACLVVLAALKPFLPHQIGMFEGPRGFALGFVSPEPLDARELLGWWAIPAFIVGGALLFLASNRALRALARWRLRSRQKQS